MRKEVIYEQKSSKKPKNNPKKPKTESAAAKAAKDNSSLEIKTPADEHTVFLRVKKAYEQAAQKRENYKKYGPLAVLISGFVYSLIIYSLKITFSVIGKALAVIILIMQDAESGGTFPIEVLPAPFKIIATFLPFKYGINALRETVAGVDAENYLKNLGALMLFIIPALVLGLLLRKPCIKIISFFNGKIEESDLVI